MENKIIRVFTHKTSYTPVDDYAFVGLPPLTLPEHKEVHVSCAFSWDKDKAEELAFQWEGRTNKPVKLGGTAYKSPTWDFVPGMYVKRNIIFTTRGCNNNCPWCIVPKVEGKLRELSITPGNIIQDNNFLQANDVHKRKVYDMLLKQKQICFKGGLQNDLINDSFVDEIRNLKIAQLWLACDTNSSLSSLKKACDKLSKAGFNRNKIYCYALIGKDMKKEEERLREIYNSGAMPFAQLYQPIDAKNKTSYNKEWRTFHRIWSRPAIIKSLMKQTSQGGKELSCASL